VWKNFILFIVFFIWGISAKGQVFTQTFIDRCTGESKVVTANFTNGPTTVAFYNRIRVFTPQEAVNGTLQQWLLETYNWWNALSPCAQASTQTQQAAQQASQAVTSVTNVLSSPPPTPPPSNNTTSSGSTTTSSNTSSSSSSGGSSSSSSEGGGSTSEGSGSSETKSETKSEESASSESGGEGESSGEGDSESESESEESSSEEDSEEEESGDSGKGVNPIIVSGDVLGMQTLQGNYNSVLSMGISKSSIYGDVSYMGNLMIWDNLNQFALGGNVTKMFLSDMFELDFIENYSVNYSYSFGVSSISAGYSMIKTFPKLGIFGGGINYSYTFGRGISGSITTFAYNFLYTRSVVVNKKLTYTPAIIYTTSPIGYLSSVEKTYVSKDKMLVLSNGIDYQISKKFRFNFNWTPIVNTNRDIPMINMFIIGSKIKI
jgi:hypothetical protein